MRCQENNIKIIPSRYQTRRKNPDRSDVGKLLPNKKENVTTYENCISIHLCLLQEEFEDDCIKKKTTFGESGLGRGINREQPFRVKRMLSGADVEQQLLCAAH